MRIFVGITDNDWFDVLSRLQPDEVNFWRPLSTQTFRALGPGEPFLFKLHSPYNYIVGGGFYVSHTILPLSTAWSLFGEKNGTTSMEQFHDRIHKYKKEKTLDPVIGCIILNEPFFFDEDDWIVLPPDWSMNIVVGKGYNTGDVTGRRLWQQVELRLQGKRIDTTKLGGLGKEEGRQYGKPYLARGRLGHGAFKALVIDAYGRRCAISGERTFPVLQASHIKPFSKRGPNLVSNGLLLRSDLHTLLDKGYMTLTKDYHLEVSKRIKEEFENGKYYYGMHGKELASLPAVAEDRPSPEFIEWHNENVFI